jgi:hypothetical protein
MGRRILIGCVVAGVLTLPPAAWAATQTARLGSVTATFTFKGKAPNYSNERLTISRAGIAVYDQPVVSSFCQMQCGPGSEPSSRSSIHVVDLDHNGEPDVVLDLYSGGAHCCSIEQIFSFDPGASRYIETERNFGDPGTRIVDLAHDGRFEFLTADDAFAYEFTDYAASGLPIQVLRFSAGYFVNVTRNYPRLVANDAGRWLAAFRRLARQHYQDSVGVVAAWAADEDLLGHAGRVNRFLARQSSAGHLRSALSPAEPGGWKFTLKLRKFLRRHGYLR